MIIQKGTKRIVCHIQSLDIVLKFPRIKLWRGLKGLPAYLKYRRMWKVPIDSNTISTPLSFLFAGLYENWKEFWFYFKTRHPLCQPTYISLFGLVNIQKYAKPFTCPGLQILDCLWVITSHGDSLLSRDMHHFGSGRNFTTDRNGKIKILDYGSRITQKIILAYGERLHKEFVETNEP